MVNREQAAIQFHINGLKMSHVDQLVIGNVVKDLHNVFRTEKKEHVKTKGYTNATPWPNH